MTDHENRIREALLIAAVNCPHEITEEQVTFYFNAAKPGNNALDKLMTRLEDAAIRALLADLDAMRADAQRYRAFFTSGLPVCFEGQDHYSKADCDAAIDAALKGADHD